MRTLLIDNQDSFTYNLFALLVEVGGEEPLVVANDETTWTALCRERFDNVVISPGPGHPGRGRDLGVTQEAVRRTNVPLLGVCLGHQAIGQAFGARVERAPQAVHGRVTKVRHAGDALFRGIPSPFTAVRYHSLQVRALPASLEATAWGDGEMLMALRHRTRPLWGVQFHPESICSEQGASLMANFGALTERFLRVQGRTTTAPSRPRVDAAGSRRAAGREMRQLTPCTRELPAPSSAEHTFVSLFGRSATAFWLDSAAPDDPRCRFSYMGEASGPLAELVRYDVHERRVTVTAQGRRSEHEERVLDYLERQLSQRRLSTDELPFGFAGGYVGYLGYECKADCGAAPGPRASTPDAGLLFADRFLAFDHRKRTVILCALAQPGQEAQAEAWLDATMTRLMALSGADGLPDPPSPAVGPPVMRHDAGAYTELVRRCLEEIAAGESYELCLTTSATASAPDTDALALYRLLRRVNPAPYGAFLRLGEMALLSSSPERFLAVERGVVETRPMKGTRRRCGDAREDEAIRFELADSEKDLAENLMIVDLARNDLTRACAPSSVHVPELFKVESYETLHQLVSTVRGRLRPDRSPVDAVRAAFPPGSMTGAPKRRAMDILDRLEEAPRGPYSGALGFFGLDGTVDLSVVIRTLIVADGQVRFGVGGAVVALSDPASEWHEVLAKAEPLQHALGHVPEAAAGEAHKKTRARI